jgi:hypothetical protein
MSMRAQSLEAGQVMEGPVSEVTARLPARRSRRLSRKTVAVLSAYTLLLPSLAVLTLFTYAPVAGVAWDSIHQRSWPRGPDSARWGLCGGPMAGKADDGPTPPR